MVYISVQAMDDRLIENQESITVTTEPRNDFDVVSPSSTTVTITDNDGKKLYDEIHKSKHNYFCLQVQLSTLLMISL